MIGVLPDKYRKGAGSVNDLSIFGDLNSLQNINTLEQMLTTPYSTDAHFTCYQVSGMPRWPLLKKNILPEIRNLGQDVMSEYLVFDWDNPKTAEGNKTPWFDGLIEQFATLIDGIQDPVLKSFHTIYTTRNGARIIYKLSKPVPVDIIEQNLVWMIKHFNRNNLPITSEQGWGIDSSCKDWTRRFRCPLVIRDGLDTSKDPFYRMHYVGTAIDPGCVGRAEVSTLARERKFNKKEQGKCPSYDYLQKLLYIVRKDNGAQAMSAFHKKAKKALKDQVEYFDMFFNDDPPLWESGTRNDEIMKMLGVTVPILLRKCGANPKEIMALAANPILTITNTDRDYMNHTWNALLDIYEREVYKLNEEEKEAAKKASIEVDLLNDMLAGVRSWCDAPELQQEDVLAREYVRRRTIANKDHYYYLMRPDGFFDSNPLGEKQLISMIRKSPLDSVIETYRDGVKGDIIDVPVTQIINNYSVYVSDIVMRAMGDTQGFIEDKGNGKPKLVLPMYRLNPNIKAKFHPVVDGWVRAFFGEDFYEIGIAWIGNALDFLGGLVCALSLIGVPGAGKKLLVHGLKECLAEPLLASGVDLTKQSDTLARTPFLNVNEGWPKDTRSGMAPADLFKSLITGDDIPVNPKFKPLIYVQSGVRCILTANDKGLLRSLIYGKDMTYHNREAIGERILHIEVNPGALDYLNSIGGRATTGKKGAEWIPSESGDGKCANLVAEQFMWYYENRTTKFANSRFLVAGNCKPSDEGTDPFSEHLMNQTRTVAVCNAIIGLADASTTSANWRPHSRTNDAQTRLYVTRAGIKDYAKDVSNDILSSSDVLYSLQNVLKASEPTQLNGVDWYEVDLHLLNRFCNTHGVANTRVRTYYENYKRLKGQDEPEQ